LQFLDVSLSGILLSILLAQLGVHFETLADLLKRVFLVGAVDESVFVFRPSFFVLPTELVRVFAVDFLGQHLHRAFVELYASHHVLKQQSRLCLVGALVFLNFGFYVSILKEGQSNDSERNDSGLPS